MINKLGTRCLLFGGSMKFLTVLTVATGFSLFSAGLLQAEEVLAQTGTRQQVPHLEPELEY